MRRKTATTLLTACFACVLIVLGSFAAPASAQAGWSLSAVGQAEPFTEAKISRGATIVVLWASWSPKCRNIVDRVNQLERRWGKVARVVTVDFQEERSAVESFLAGKSLSVPVYLDTDGAFSKKYALTTLPGLIVFQDGEARFRGKMPNDPDRTIGDLLGR